MDMIPFFFFFIIADLGTAMEVAAVRRKCIIVAWVSHKVLYITARVGLATGSRAVE